MHRKKPLIIYQLIIALFLVVAGAGFFGLHTHAMNWLEIREAEIEVYQAPVEELDNIDKLTLYLEETMRQMQETQETLLRAETALEDAQQIHAHAVDEYNQAIEAINLYGGNI